jgi:hypothetical protein
VCIIATGPYEAQASALIESGRRFFCTNHDVTYFVFTDILSKIEAKDAIRVSQASLGWPYNSLKRFHVYEDHAVLFEKMDYLFAVHADMVFKESLIGDILAASICLSIRNQILKEFKKVDYHNLNPLEFQWALKARYKKWAFFLKRLK